MAHQLVEVAPAGLDGPGLHRLADDLQAGLGDVHAEVTSTYFDVPATAAGGPLALAR